MNNSVFINISRKYILPVNFDRVIVRGGKKNSEDSQDDSEDRRRKWKKARTTCCYVSDGIKEELR